MSSQRGKLVRGVLGILALVSLVKVPIAAQEPAYIRGLTLPVLHDAIGYPRGVTADLHAEEVFVCDTRKNRIVIFDEEGFFLFQIPGGDVFSAPRDIAIDPEGYLLVLANHQRRQALIELDFDGLFLREVSLTGLPDETPAPDLSSVSVSPSGDRIYALDRANLRLWIANRSGAIATSVDLAPGLSEKDRREVILGHVDVYGETVLVAVPSAGEVRMFDLDGGDQTVVGGPRTARCKVAFPVAAALAENGELVIVDQKRMLVLRWDPETNSCLGEYIGLGNLPGFLYHPKDIALDRSGRIYISQGFQGRVQMYEGMVPAAAPSPTP